MLQNQRPALIGALTCWRQASPGAKVHRTISSTFYLLLHRSPPRHPTPMLPNGLQAGIGICLPSNSASADKQSNRFCEADLRLLREGFLLLSHCANWSRHWAGSGINGRRHGTEQRAIGLGQEQVRGGFAASRREDPAGLGGAGGWSPRLWQRRDHGEGDGHRPFDHRPLNREAGGQVGAGWARSRSSGRKPAVGQISRSAEFGYK